MARKRKKTVRSGTSPAGSTRATILLSDPQAYDMLCLDGYTKLSKNPEVVTAVMRIADLISSMTIHLMANTANGDTRIINELSRKIDINPNRYMTRKTFISAVVKNMLLTGDGNSVVRVRTRNGLIDDLEPIPPSRVGFFAEGYGYNLRIDGKKYSADDVIHCVWMPDDDYPWYGTGIRVALKDILANLTQARKTENAFMSSKYKPPLVVKVDGLSEDFASKAGRAKLSEEYLETAEDGQPWIIPADLIDVKEIRPLSLSDLAINDTVEIDKRAVAALIGVPAFLLGVGDYDQKAWNSFINNTIRPICRGIEQEFTRKLILSPKWYFRFNTTSLMDWDLEQIAEVYGSLSDRGIVTGNEVRDKLGMSPLEGLDKPRILENYIPVDKIGDQKKLIQGGNDE
jgi:HK97 family phage portal protein